MLPDPKDLPPLRSLHSSLKKASRHFNNGRGPGGGNPLPPEIVSRLEALIIEGTLKAREIAVQLGIHYQSVYHYMRKLQKEGRAERRYNKPQEAGWEPVEPHRCSICTSPSITLFPCPVCCENWRLEVMARRRAFERRMDYFACDPELQALALHVEKVLLAQEKQQEKGGYLYDNFGRRFARRST